MKNLWNIEVTCLNSNKGPTHPNANFWFLIKMFEGTLPTHTLMCKKAGDINLVTWTCFQPSLFDNTCGHVCFDRYLIKRKTEKGFCKIQKSVNFQVTENRKFRWKHPSYDFETFQKKSQHFFVLYGLQNKNFFLLGNKAFIFFEEFQLISHRKNRWHKLTFSGSFKVTRDI